MSDQPLVLMYHSILSSLSQVPHQQERGGAIYSISVDQFRSHLRVLKERGLGPEDVVITFDDGEENNYKNALPVLKEMGFKALFFVIVKRIGLPGYMNWVQLKQLLKEGMTIGSHGLTHTILTGLLDSQMQEELRASKKTLEINLGKTIETLSIPRGFCSDKIINTAYDLGYKTVYISQRPVGLKELAIARVAVKRHWDLNRFCMALDRKKPLAEQANDTFIQMAKTVLRGSMYNWLRNAVLKFS